MIQDTLGHQHLLSELAYIWIGEGHVQKKLIKSMLPIV